MSPNRVTVLGALLVSMLWTGFTPDAHAGQFWIDGVTYVTQQGSVSDTTRVLVGATAQYRGTVDDQGSDWVFQTELDVYGTTHYGRTYSEDHQTFVYSENMIITLDPHTYGADAAVENCSPSGNGTHYLGYGTVTITHWMQLGANDETDSAPGTWGLTNCTSPPEEEGPGGGEEGGEESPPGDGSGVTPILVDLDRGGFKLTDLSAGVRFDLDRDGVSEALSWTEPGSGDGWLALDRNRNGTIDDGGELFGNFTDQPVRNEPHGYLALQVFDDDGDGRISDADPVYPDLLLWVDRDHDGASDPSELIDLATAGVDWIGVDFVESRSRDRHGNEFRYRCGVRLSRSMTQSRDVFLLSGP